jgi:hypothetical protein
MAKKKYKFPVMIYVEREEYENDDPSLVVHETPEAAAEAFNDVTVAIYKFERMAKVKTTAVLE